MTFGLVRYAFKVDPEFPVPIFLIFIFIFHHFYKKVDIAHHFKRKQTLLNTPAISKKVMPGRDSVGSPNKAKNQLKAADDVAMQVDTLILENIFLFYIKVDLKNPLY